MPHKTPLMPHHYPINVTFVVNRIHGVQASVATMLNSSVTLVTSFESLRKIYFKELSSPSLRLWRTMQVTIAAKGFPKKHIHIAAKYLSQKNIRDFSLIHEWGMQYLQKF